MYEKLWNDLKASVEPELVRTMEAMEELAEHRSRLDAGDRAVERQRELYFLVGRPSPEEGVAVLRLLAETRLP